MVPANLRWKDLEVLGAARPPSAEGHGFAARHPIVRLRGQPAIAFVVPDVTSPEPQPGNLISEAELREGFDSETLFLTDPFDAERSHVLVTRGNRYRNAVQGLEGDLSWRSARNISRVDYAYVSLPAIELWRSACREFLQTRGVARLRKALQSNRSATEALALLEEGTFACDVGSDDRFQIFTLIGVAVRGQKEAWARLLKIIRFEFPSMRDFEARIRSREAELRVEPRDSPDWAVPGIEHPPRIKFMRYRTRNRRPAEVTA